MPKRMLSDGVLTSPRINSVSAEAELFFYRLLVVCDDHGCMDARPDVLRSACYPLRVDSVKAHHVEKWLTELAGVGLIERYEVKGLPYLAFAKWNDHQRFRHEARGKYPLPAEGTPLLAASCGSLRPEVRLSEEKRSQVEGTARELFAPTGSKVPVPVESWPEGLRWVPPIVERVFDRFPETFGTRGDFLQPTKWRSLEAEVDSWGQGLNQRFADELEAVLGEFQGYWTSRKSRRRDAWRTWLNACRRWHDRQLSGALRLQALKTQRPQRRIA